MNNIKELINNDIVNMDLDKKINYINELREFIHNISPFKNEPIDFVKWVKNNNVVANDYNPNKVAPPEMQDINLIIPPYLTGADRYLCYAHEGF